MRFAFLFPGQGAQYPGMAKKYLIEFPYLREFYIRANEILDFDLLDLCLNGFEDKLNLTANAQPAILILSYCAFQVLIKEFNIKPFLLAGHSLGEISALCCSNAVKFEDAVKIVRKRGELMQAAVNESKGAMLVINGLKIEQVESLCNSDLYKGKAVISNINSEKQIVISGEKESVEAIGEKAARSGASVIPLKVSAPFHSPFMRPAASGLETELNKYKYSGLKYPVISNATCKPYLNENEIIPLLTEQVTKTVNWLKIMEYITKTSVDIAIELPPKKTLTKIFSEYTRKIKCYSFEETDKITDILKTENVY